LFIIKSFALNYKLLEGKTISLRKEIKIIFWKLFKDIFINISHCLQLSLKFHRLKQKLIKKFFFVFMSFWDSLSSLSNYLHDLRIMCFEYAKSSAKNPQAIRSNFLLLSTCEFYEAIKFFACVVLSKKCCSMLIGIL
jgi:hypothetical protein